MNNNLNKNIAVGIFGFFASEGIEVINMDIDNQILTITIPKDSYSYYNDNETTIKSPDDLAKRIKEFFIQLGVFKENSKVRYKLRDVVWTKEMSDKNFEEYKKYL